MSRPKQLIILGGGSSVIEGIYKDLFKKIKNKFTFGINYSHFFVDTTCLFYIDDVFYLNQLAYLEKLPLTIGKAYSNTPSRSNNIQLPTHNTYVRDCANGVYKATLSGIFALTLGIHLLDEGDIFLLGYDYGAKKGTGEQGRCYDEQDKALTHWYQYGNMKSRYTGNDIELRHRGTGKVNWYEATEMNKRTHKRISRAEKEFQVYSNESKVKIYNVSQESKIPIFEKISYEEFFKKLNGQVYDQAEIRKDIRAKLKLLPQTYKR